MKAVDVTQQHTKEEVDRLGRNWRALLDVMPEMVFLIGEDFLIEYMNPAAVLTFGDLCKQYCHDALCTSEDGCKTSCPVKLATAGQLSEDLIETRIGEVDVEFSYVPFEGYMGDHLVMVVMRNSTQRKKHEREIAEFHNNIENILQQKISQLKESEKIRDQLSQEVNTLQLQLKKHGATDEMVGSSKKMRELREMIYQVADSDANIMITGESGTGKELVASLIRNCSGRKGKPFLKVNCNAINDNLLESDLFGHEKGSFTGASARKKGKFEIVDTGTIFLDEIGDISAKMQSSLLRVLQNGEIMRVGSNTCIQVDVRVIAATNVDLAKAVQEGRFRLDLYYRLNIINIPMPALRERKEDIVELASFFVKHYRSAFKKEIDFIPSKIIDHLLQHDWPGNVRELENVIQRAVLMAKSHIITEQDIIFDANPSSTPPGDMCSELGQKLKDMSLKDLLADLERDLIVATLKKSKSNVQKTANMLNIGKTALYDKMKRYEISAKSPKK
jgi:transcriptional regulator with PAS, ATPase and Fis domain